MLNFDFQLNNNSAEHKTLTEIVEEAFTTKKPVVDLSFFYNENNSKDIYKIKPVDVVEPTKNPPINKTVEQKIPVKLA